MKIPNSNSILSRRARVSLKKDYRLTMEMALILSLVVTITAVRMPVDTGDEGLVFTLATQETVQMEEIQQTQQIEKPPPPPRPPVPVEVPNDAVLDDIELNLDVSLDLDAFVELPPPPAPPPEIVVEDEPEIFVVVEQMPEIIGGNAKVYENLVYPDIARQAGVEGLSVIQVVVEPNGLPSDITVARSASDVLDQAAMRAVSQLRFVPGKQRGVPVRVRMAIPIRFRLKKVTS
jgi:periplasmic protein TonB